MMLNLIRMNSDPTNYCMLRFLTKYMEKNAWHTLSSRKMRNVGFPKSWFPEAC